ncbi:MAG TPA: agmatine deiminase family protein, partial [Candidatus Cloacimonadota bacterium]|nr:agmatine deiminase family protein [Candidatus Cloacimonadota bacterium]
MKSWKLQLLLICLALIGALQLAAHAVLPADTLPYAWDLRFVETPPPVGPVRPVAEFEPASHVLIRYPLGIPAALVAHLSNTAQVICLVGSTGQQYSATTTFNNAGANMANISFEIAPTDSYWTRDYGPWFAFDGEGDLAVVDFVYNRPRPNDNMIPQIFAQAQGLDYYGMNLTQTGGNYMTDGINTAAQTHIAYSENGNNQANVNNKMLSYLGVTNYLIVTDPNATYINHIDCWGKFLAPDKVLIRSVPSSHAQYTQIEAAANYFATHLNAWGYPYRVYRVYTPNNQPYTNSLILNNKVFVPIMNSTNDAAALQVYRDAMPGYEVIGIVGSSSAPWESTDALHCRTHEIPDRDMLHISHNPYHGEHPYIDSLLFSANIRPHSNMPVYADSVFVSYRINSGTWQNQMLSYDNGTHYMTNIGGFAPGDTIRYYIHAADQSGRN